MKRHSLTKNILIKGILLLFCSSLAWPAGVAAPAYARQENSPTTEYELKAIYLYNFLQFVQWPDDTCGLPNGHAQEIAVLGDASFNKVLKTLQEKLKLKNKDLSLTFYGPYQIGMDLSDCCLLFIADSERPNLNRILKSVAGKPILTVADSDTSLEKGVMIALIPYQNKIRWAINRKSINAAGLRVSAKLLQIAVKVIE